MSARPSLNMAVLCAALVLAALTYGRCTGGRDGVADERDRLAAEAQRIVNAAYRTQRDSTDAAVRRTQDAEAQVKRAGAHVDTSVASVATALADARAVLASTNEKQIETDLVVRLRGSLRGLTETVERLVIDLTAYRFTVDSLTVAMTLERAAWQAERAKAQLALDAANARIKALLDRRCRINLLVTTVPCPTRTQALVVGVGGTLAAGLILH